MRLETMTSVRSHVYRIERWHTICDSGRSHTFHTLDLSINMQILWIWNRILLTIKYFRRIPSNVPYLFISLLCLEQSISLLQDFCIFNYELPNHEPPEWTPSWPAAIPTSAFSLIIVTILGEVHFILPWSWHFGIGNSWALLFSIYIYFYVWFKFR